MAEALCWLPETTTTLLNGHTPIQSKKFKVWQEKSQVTDAQNWKSSITYLNWLGLKAKMILFLEMEINSA